ncbi:MAG: prephenate/arogenate dehydrogenase family protein [Rhodospirillaceae bacterium]|nr:prephenate/arogenate dehydrogenase family protein [Rhodospirillaceae bacterium]MBT7249865.1 prephenate/arogenate dehydrogenase family protein [Rhodospirillaceae bacterium]
MADPLFQRIALLGIGLIGSSLAHVIRRENLAGHVAIYTRRAETLAKAEQLGLGDSYHARPADAAADADLVIFCAPLGANASLAEAIGASLKSGACITDVGSCKGSVIRDIGPHLPEGVSLVPAHPVAGTEHSGPESGFAELFDGRWCILTPAPETDEDAVSIVTEFWCRAGSDVEIMDADHHDRVLAITSHLPHLIAYTIVDTASELERDLRKEVVKFSAGGFRDFTRIAASDPTMWRDVFLNNREAVLDILGRFTEDLTALQRAIRRGDGDALHDAFTRTRKIRRGVIDAKQA